MFGGRMIVFGILHFIFLASILGLLFLRLYLLNLVLGSALILLGNLYQNAVFDNPWLHWIGLMTFKPLTEDYVPLLPWFGVVLLGIFAGHGIYRNPYLQSLCAFRSRHRIARSLAYLGKHSLLIYVLHQPILYGCVWAVSQAGK
jgi:uncharacterized membrane protein